MPPKGDTYITVVVPVYNGGPQFAACLDALLASDSPFVEIVVVDDGSTDGSAAAARARGVKVLRTTSRSGPAAARNLGARHARGSVLMFVDADVVVGGDTLARTAALFRARPEVEAVFGSYDDAPAESNFVSQYKNLLHHFVHQRASPRAETFWAGCGAVRRAAFEAVGALDAGRYARPSVEDIELGYRLRRRGFEIVLDGGLQVKHLKRWTLPSLLRTDIFRRALPWSQLVLERGRVADDLNLRVSERVAACLVGAACALLAASYFNAFLALAALAALAGVAAINLPLLRFFKVRRGARFAAGAFALHCLYYLYSGTVFSLCCVAHALKKVGGAFGDGRPAARAATYE